MLRQLLLIAALCAAVASVLGGSDQEPEQARTVEVAGRPSGQPADRR